MFLDGTEKEVVCKKFYLTKDFRALDPLREKIKVFLFHL